MREVISLVRGGTDGGDPGAWLLVAILVVLAACSPQEHDHEIATGGNGPVLHLSSDWQGAGERWRLQSVGRLWVARAEADTFIELHAAEGAVELRRATRDQLRLGTGCTAILPVGLGDYPALRVGPVQGRVLLDPLRLTTTTQVETTEVIVVPAAAHSGHERDYEVCYRSAIELHNTGSDTVRCRLRLLTGEDANDPEPPPVVLAVAPGSLVTASDLVAALFACEGFGALRLEADGAGLVVTGSLTRAESGSHTDLPIAAVHSSGFITSTQPGLIALPVVLLPNKPMAYLDLVNPGRVGTVVGVEITSRHGRLIHSEEFEVPAESQTRKRIQRGWLPRWDGDLSLLLRNQQPGSAVVASLSISGTGSERWSILQAVVTEPQ